MKTTRRHELQTNELADSLAHWIEAIKPYSRAALALVVALVVLIFSWSYWSAQGARRNAEGWNEYFDAMAARDPRKALSDISSRYAGTSVAEWARLALAEIQLFDGTNRLLVEKKDARDELVMAAEKFQAVLVESREPTLNERATYGLARATKRWPSPKPWKRPATNIVRSRKSGPTACMQALPKNGPTIWIVWPPRVSTIGWRPTSRRARWPKTPERRGCVPTS